MIVLTPCINLLNLSWIKLEMCQYDTDVPAQRPSSPACRHFAKNEVDKRVITLIIISGFYPKSNLNYIL